MFRVDENHWPAAQTSAPWFVEGGWVFIFTAAAYNLVRIRNVQPAA